MTKEKSEILLTEQEVVEIERAVQKDLREFLEMIDDPKIRKSTAVVISAMMITDTILEMAGVKKEMELEYLRLKKNETFEEFANRFRSEYGKATDKNLVSIWNNLNTERMNQLPEKDQDRIEVERVG